VKKQRPVNLDLTQFDFPASAKASILHRVSGVAMLFALAFLVWAWQESLSSAEGFAFVQDIMTSFIAKFIAWGILTVISYHMLGGIRHMLMDLGYFENVASGNNRSKFIIAVWLVLSVAAGVWLWM